MFPPFSQEPAHHYCTILVSMIENKDAELEKIAKESEERKNLGVMLGCLVGRNKETGRRTVVYAVSGNRFRLKFSKTDFSPCGPDFLIAPSIADYDAVQNVLKENDEEIHFLTKKINSLCKNSSERNALEKKRTELTTASLKKVHSLYTFCRFDGREVSLNQIIKNHGGKLPPTGTGDCCEPKLLNFAFKNKIEPLSMTEIYYGNAKNKTSLTSYPPCDERCALILPEMFNLEILYKDKDIIVASKPANLLSVPGRTKENQFCAENIIKALYPHEIEKGLQTLAVHRLDMETSGIIIFALNKKSLEKMNKQFREKSVQKKYTALLDGVLYSEKSGHIELKTRLDVNNRPHQIYDEENGKLGITDWKNLGIETLEFFDKDGNKIRKKVTRVEFFPKTGRTHQLRLASSNIHGLNIPIAGDSLYGKNDCPRLFLHAQKITFEHPTSKKILTFESKVPF